MWTHRVLRMDFPATLPLPRRTDKHQVVFLLSYPLTGHVRDCTTVGGMLVHALGMTKRFYRIIRKKLAKLPG